jgi:hypothetical protein
MYVCTYVHTYVPIDIRVNLDGEQNKRFGEKSLSVYCMVAVPLAQFFKQKSSQASQQVCRPGAEQADKFMF